MVRRLSGRAGTAVAAVCLLVATGATSAERHTERCNTRYGSDVVVRVDRNKELATVLRSAVGHAEVEFPLKWELWTPTAIRHGNLSGREGSYYVLSYSDGQDLAEILRSLHADTTLAAKGLEYADEGSVLCFASGPPPQRKTFTEYANAGTGHYLMATSPAEITLVESGGWGPGWQPTGETIDTYATEPCSAHNRKVFRFLGTSASGSPPVFYVLNSEICGALRHVNAGWRYLDAPLGAYPVEEGLCGAGQRPVFQLYNNRWRENDSNHRYTDKFTIYLDMQSRGWVGEGVAFCVK